MTLPYPRRTVNVDGLDVTVLTARWLPRQVDAITFPSLIVFRRGCDHDPILLRHEVEHIRQYRKLGTAKFVIRYVGDYVSGRRSGLGHHDAYLSISLEIDARAAAAQQED